MNRRLKPFNYCMSHNRIKSPKPAFRLPSQLPKHICYMPTHVQTTYQFSTQMQMRDTHRPLNMSSHPEVPVHPQTDSLDQAVAPFSAWFGCGPYVNRNLRHILLAKSNVRGAWTGRFLHDVSPCQVRSKYMCFQTCLKAQKELYHPNYEPRFFVFVASSLGKKGFFSKTGT